MAVGGEVWAVTGAAFNIETDGRESAGDLLVVIGLRTVAQSLRRNVLLAS